MKQENYKIDQLNEIYSAFTKGNKDNLLKTAESLLKIQNKDKSLIDISKKEVRRNDVFN